MARRVRDWLIKQAKDEITRLAQEKAQMLGKTFTKISVRDTVSRWGSCSNTGSLSFSWRLMFAPPEVLDYVVSHEVAHLAELNHSRAFWKVVAGICPHWQQSRAWLRKNGASLYHYG